MLAVIIPISILNIRMLSGSNLSALAMDAGC
jgi:rhamnose transport system ATP-binding protein